MGKVNIKQKAKIAAAKRRNEANTAPVANPFELQPPQAQTKEDKNLPTVEDFENKSVISFKALHGVTKSKKEKLKLRKKLWHEKIEVCKNKAKKKSKSAPGKKILEGENGFQLLLDSLPSVKDRVNELKASKASISAAAAVVAASSSKPAKRKTDKQRVKEDLRNIETFRQVLKHPEFQKSPMDTMLEHLKNKQEMEKNGELMEEDGNAAPKKKSRNRNRRRKEARATQHMES